MCAGILALTIFSAIEVLVAQVDLLWPFRRKKMFRELAYLSGSPMQGLRSYAA